MVAPYYSDLPKKADYLKSFLDGHWHILACTSAISAGFDFTNIDLVIHYGLLWGLTDWVQQSGRLSRDPSKVGHSVIFTQTNQYEEPRDLEEDLIQKYAALDGCWWAFINALYNDQIEQFCKSPDLSCDFCHGRALILEETSAQALQANQKVAQNEAQLKEYMDIFQERCIICLMAWMDDFEKLWRHLPFNLEAGTTYQVGPQCPNWPLYAPILQKFDHYWGIWNSPKPNSCHYSCLLPSRFCHQWYTSDPSDTSISITNTSNTSTSSTRTRNLPASGPRQCPGRNPIYYWACMIQELNAWHWID